MDFFAKTAKTENWPRQLGTLQGENARPFFLEAPFPVRASCATPGSQGFRYIQNRTRESPPRERIEGIKRRSAQAQTKVKEGKNTKTK